jgi:hypothetical protein
MQMAQLKTEDSSFTFKLMEVQPQFGRSVASPQAFMRCRQMPRLVAGGLNVQQAALCV